MARTAIVVDDDPALHTMLARALTDIGLTARSFCDGESALAFLDANREIPEVVTTDLMMPGMTGFTFVNELRARRPLARVPIIVASARVEVRDAVRAGKLGVTFMTKPFRLREYLCAVERLIEFSKPFEIARHV